MLKSNDQAGKVGKTSLLEIWTTHKEYVEGLLVEDPSNSDLKNSLEKTNSRLLAIAAGTYLEDRDSGIYDLHD